LKICASPFFSKKRCFFFCLLTSAAVECGVCVLFQPVLAVCCVWARVALCFPPCFLHLFLAGNVCACFSASVPSKATCQTLLGPKYISGSFYSLFEFFFNFFLRLNSMRWSQNFNTLIAKLFRSECNHMHPHTPFLITTASQYKQATQAHMQRQWPTCNIFILFILLVDKKLTLICLIIHGLQLIFFGCIWLVTFFPLAYEIQLRLFQLCMSCNLDFSWPENWE
jgi:hypothetical protein